MMPVLREMVELLFEKKYIKLLFATETFAVGINMPTKTVIFTGLTKYSGNGMRYLLPHEYTQMAGRAGRRGIDTVGHVIHCNNLFNMNSNPNEYRNMLTGPPKMLTSQFKISYNLIISIISANKNNLLHNIDNGLISFMEKSFMQTDIVKEINNYDKCQKEIEESIATQELQLIDITLCRTEKSILKQYFDLKNKIEFASNKQKKKFIKDLELIEKDNKFLKNDIVRYNNLEKTKLELQKNNCIKFKTIIFLQL
jgi:superfamily II RNA helicase